MANKIIHLLLLIFLFLFFGAHAHISPRWTVFIYLEATDNLGDMAIKNLTDLAFADSNVEVTFIAQVHAFGNTAIRFKIEKQKLIPLEYITLTNSEKQNFIDANRWAYSNYKAEKNMLVIWNHGWGILEPVWDPKKKIWHVESDILDEMCCQTVSTRIYTDHSYEHGEQHVHHRGFLSNAYTHAMLTNNDLIDALEQIVTVFPEKKLDIIGFDTCMGAQLEISYQLTPYAHYQIGCQNCELKDGWHYRAIGMQLKPETTARELALLIIESYHDYYQNKSLDGSYTISAIDLFHVKKIFDQLQLVIKLLITFCKEQPELKKIIIETRLFCTGFCFIPMYTDLFAFFRQLTDRLSNYRDERIPVLTSEINTLQMLLKKAIIANKTGSQLHDKAHGLSIYFPVNHIDSSYRQSLFAQKSLWLTFLKELIS